MSIKFLKRLEALEERYKKVEEELSKPEIFKDFNKYQSLSKEFSELKEKVELIRDIKKLEKDIAEAKDILENEEDEELKELAKQELENLEKQKEELINKLKRLLLPKDPNDERNVILEIRAGAGGEEAALFAADLFKMYSKYAEKRGWKVEIMSSHPTDMGGFKEIIALFKGKNVYSRLKYESGVHRVQRIPVTEAYGRIHTSTVTVAILPEMEEVDVRIDPKDIKIEVFRASGPGGQHVNVTDSAVRITHIPTGIVVQCQDERSQHQNKSKAIKILRARLYEYYKKQQEEKIAKERKMQIGSGERSEKIRTYNFPQSRVTDHRINLTLYKLDEILQGDLDEIIDALIINMQAKELEKIEI